MIFLIGLGIGLCLGYFGKELLQGVFHHINDRLKARDIRRARKLIEGTRADIDVAEESGAEVKNARLQIERAEGFLQRGHLDHFFLERIRQLVWVARGQIQIAIDHLE